MPSSNPLPFVVFGAGLILCIPLVWWYSMGNRLVRLYNSVATTWSDVDASLKRRYDLIPSLVDAVKGYAGYESTLVDQITAQRLQAMRAAGEITSHAASEQEMVHSLNQLLALVESYPELKTSERFLALQQELVNTEDRIAAARRFYNANVRDYNAALETFPLSLVAKSRSLPKAEYFEVEDLAIRKFAPSI